MKDLAQPQLDALRRRCLTLAVCWRITRADGQVFRYTAHDQALTIDGQTYTPNNAFTSSAVQSKADLSVDNVTMVALTSDQITEADLLRGRFDDAALDVFAVDWTQAAPVEIPLRRGFFGEVELKGARFEVEVRGLTQLINQKVGRVYARTCDADLGDSRCGVDLAAYTVTGTVTQFWSRKEFADATRTEAADHFTYGLLTWTSGANAGLKIEVFHFEGGVFTLWDRMPYPLAGGDAYSVHAGCDKLIKTCIDKFANADNFRGFPYIPGSDKRLQTPNSKA